MGVQEQEQLWGGETTKAVNNFPVSGEPTRSASSAGWGASRARPRACNAQLGLLDADLAERIAAAGDRSPPAIRRPVPIDVFQTGSGTSSNMNANEVIATPRARARTPTTT